MTDKLWIVLAPALVIVIGVLVIRRAAWQVALSAVAAVVAVFAVVLGTTEVLDTLPSSVSAGLLLTADAGLIILPGLLLNELLKQTGTHARIVAWVEAWPVSPAVATVLLTAGFAPALESITGFGVSLLVTVPVLLQILPRGKALLASMLSLTIMPWGTAGLATTVAADLSGIPLRDVGVHSAFVSAAIFPIFAVLTALLVADRSERIKVTGLGASLGMVFAAVLIAMNLASMISLAGVAAGAVTGVAGYVFLTHRNKAAGEVPWWALAPFFAVVGIILLVRLIDAVTEWGSAVAVHAGRVVFEPLLSPGLALLIVALAIGWRYLTPTVLGEAVRGGWKPLTALFGFATAAQLMNHSGAVADLAALVGDTGDFGFVVLVPLLAVLSGYLVGSNTGANALMVISQQSIGEHFGAGTEAVSLQNSGAGHSVFASVPETLLVLAIAGSGTRAEETKMLRFGFSILGVVLAVMIIAAGISLVVA